MGKEGKEQKPKKAKNGFRTFMRFLQHVSLAVMALSIFVVVIGSTVRIQGFRSGGSYMLDSSDQNKEYEDSDLFGTIFGYAVADIIRYGVVSSQLETDGVFDGSKIVDVTAYNYRDVGLPEQYVTAEYHLEDLLKWANYGFEYTTTDMTEQQAGQFLSDRTRVTIIDPQSKYYNTSDANYLKSDIGSYTFVNDVSANQLWVENYDNSDPQEYDGFVEGYLSVGDNDQAVSATEEITLEVTEGDASYDSDYAPVYSHDILINRYKTAEEKNLEEYVSDWDLYYNLCENVENAAKSLSYNYNEYLEYGDYYSKENSNVRYLIAKTVGENTQFYSNLDGDEEENILEAMMGIGDITENGFASDKYIYYSPSEMVYRTNTSIEETTIRKILQEYDYAYPETVKIWIGVDTDYPVSDAFTQGAAGFRNYLPYFWQWIIVAIVAGILYLCLFIYQIIFTGRDVDANGEACIRLNAFDRIPTEAAALIAFGVAVLAVWILIVVLELADIHVLSLSYGEVVYEQWFKILLVAGTFAADIVVMFFFYSLVRRMRAKALWKNSYLRRLCCKLKEFAWKVYDNGNIVIRTWVPYGIFLFFNLMMVVWEIETAGSWLPVIVVLFVDAAVGILFYRDAKERQGIVEGIETIASGELEHQVEITNLHGDNLTLANSVNSIGKGIKDAVEISMKDERMKADLITNVSHDIKTPLTSIINYVDLIKREHVENEKVQNYIKVLDEKSQRLKQLTDDLVEASKISSGNISLNFERINVTELMNQTIGEFSEKFEQKNLTTVMNVNVQNSVIEADSRRIWRVMENLFNNIYKYAMTGTRVYVTIDSLQDNDDSIEISIKNISASALNCNPDELTERFIRGDVSRTTEGSGLGLSIAKNLTEAQKGTFEIRLDGDLFKVYLTFPLAK
ncbi:MAG: HAMP domain-containing histidine kinase [Lachnospiraceae bacterium]|nr:HAMP domain-containing histidine kinase [Lachnospiraceae bacterium]